MAKVTPKHFSKQQDQLFQILSLVQNLFFEIFSLVVLLFSELSIILCYASFPFYFACSMLNSLYFCQQLTDFLQKLLPLPSQSSRICEKLQTFLLIVYSRCYFFSLKLTKLILKNLVFFRNLNFMSQLSYQHIYILIINASIIIIIQDQKYYHHFYFTVLYFDKFFFKNSFDYFFLNYYFSMMETSKNQPRLLKLPMLRQQSEQRLPSQTKLDPISKGCHFQNTNSHSIKNIMKTINIQQQSSASRTLLKSTNSFTRATLDRRYDTKESDHLPKNTKLQRKYYELSHLTKDISNTIDNRKQLESAKSTLETSKLQFSIKNRQQEQAKDEQQILQQSLTHFYKANLESGVTLKQIDFTEDD